MAASMGPGPGRVPVPIPVARAAARVVGSAQEANLIARAAEWLAARAAANHQERHPEPQHSQGPQRRGETKHHLRRLEVSSDEVEVVVDWRVVVEVEEASAWRSLTVTTR